MKPLLIIARRKPVHHYEVHYVTKVDFVTLDGKLVGSSKVEAV